VPDPIRIQTPPGSVLVLHLPDLGLTPEDAEPAAEELHRLTGLPVVLTDDGTDLSVTTREEAEAAMVGALMVTADLPRDERAEGLLDGLAVDGWALVRLRRP
jgi:hypothetical protein